MNQEQETSIWAIVSMMGHQKLAGKLDTYTIGGASYLRVTVPETKYSPAFTRLLTDKAVYCIDPCDEQTARYKAEELRVTPIEIWDVNQMVAKQLEREEKVIVHKSAVSADFGQTLNTVLSDPTQHPGWDNEPDEWDNDEPDEDEYEF